MVYGNGYAVGPPLLPTPRPSAPSAYCVVCVCLPTSGRWVRDSSKPEGLLVMLLFDTQPSQVLKIQCSSSSSRPKKMFFSITLAPHPSCYSLLLLTWHVSPPVSSFFPCVPHPLLLAVVHLTEDFQNSSSGGVDVASYEREGRTDGCL